MLFHKYTSKHPHTWVTSLLGFRRQGRNGCSAQIFLHGLHCNMLSHCGLVNYQHLPKQSLLKDSLFLAPRHRKSVSSLPLITKSIITRLAVWLSEGQGRRQAETNMNLKTLSCKAPWTFRLLFLLECFLPLLWTGYSIRILSLFLSLSSHSEIQTESPWDRFHIVI